MILRWRSGKLFRVNAVRFWGFDEFSIAEGNAVTSSGSCPLCKENNRAGEFVLLVSEEGRTSATAVHLSCLSPDLRRTRGLVIGLVRRDFGQDQQKRLPQQA